MAKVVGELEIQLFAELARIRKDMEGARQIVGSAMQSIERAVSAAKQVLGSLGLGFGLVGIVALVDQYSKYNAQLKLVTSSARELAAAQDEVRRISTLAQADLSATGVLYARITNATRELGTTQRQVGQITEVVSLALKVSGATAQESASAMLQLSQAFGSGKFRGEEFNAVNEAAPRLMKALADGIGVPVGALREMASAGQITAAVMARALPQALMELRKEAIEVQTIGGAFAVLKNAVMEFVGAQAIGNNGVAAVSAALVKLADNLGTVAAVLAGITAMKIAAWLAAAAQAFYVKAAAALASVQANQAERASNIAAMQSEIARTASTLEFIVAERARAVAQLSGAQATIAATAAVGAMSYALRLNAEAAALNSVAVTNLANLGKMQAAATTAQVAAQTALTAAQGAGGMAATIGARALALLGGPIGLVTTLLGLGVTAWMLWGKSSEDASKKAASETVASTWEITQALDKQILLLEQRLALAEKFGEIVKGENANTIRAAGLNQQITELKERQSELQASGSRLDRNEQFRLNQAQYDLEYLLARIKKEASVSKRLGDIGQLPLIEKWLEKYADKVEKLAFVLAKAKKEFGGTIPPEVETAIRAKFSAADEKKAMNEAEAAANTYATELANLSKQIGVLNGVGEVEAYQLRLQESAFRNVSAAKKDFLVHLFATIIARKDEIETMRQQTRSALELADAMDQIERGREDYLQSVRDAESDMVFEVALIGKTADETQRLAAARRLDAQMLQAVKALGPNASSRDVQDIMDAADAAKIRQQSLLAMNQVLGEQQNRWKNLATAAGQYFGQVGAGVGKLISTMVDLGKTEADLAAKRIAIAKDPAIDPEKRAMLEDQVARQSAQARLGAYGDMATAAAGFFDTQSRGYKSLMAVSQVFHAAELALTLAELVPKAISAILTQGEGDPYTAFARMAAMTAIVAGLGVAVGGGGGGGGVSAADRQASQGTGSVLGDTRAKSESIVKAMDMLGKNSIIGNEHTAAMVRSLQSIESNIGGLAALIARNAGLSGGDAAGMGLGTSGGSGAFAVGVKSAGALGGAVIGAQIGAMFGGAIGVAIGAVAGGILGALGAIKTKVSLADTGIQFGGQTLGDARRGVTGNSYTDITSQNSYLWGLIKGKPSTTRSTGALSPEITRQFTMIIDGLYGSILNAATIFGSNAAAIGAALDAFNIDMTSISFKDLTGEQIEKELRAVFSKIGDDLAGTAFAGLDRFQHVGEGLFETLMRLAQEFAATDAVAKILGKDVATAFGEIGFASMGARDALVELFGGIQQLSDGVSKYYELYYTDGERAQRTLDMLKVTFAELGEALPGSMADYRQLVESQDLSTAAGRGLFTTLIQLAPAFNTVAAAARTMADDIYASALTIGGGLSAAAKESAMQSAATAWNAYYNNYAGTSIDNATTIANARLASMQAAGGNRALLDSMIEGAMSIGGFPAAQLLQNLFNAIAINTDATNTNSGASDDAARVYLQGLAALANARSGLADYLNKSILSEMSPLTPMQKYVEAKRQYDANLKLAQGDDINAIAGFGGIRDAFLAASRTIFASSGQYNTDYFGSFSAGAAMTNGAVRPYTAADGTANATMLATVITEGTNVQRQIAAATVAVGNAVIENAQDNTAETKAVLREAVDALTKIANKGGSLVSNGFS